MQEIIRIAKTWGIPYKVGLSKEYLIREIQKKEGYTACYQRDDFCEEKDCLWMDDCFPKKKMPRS